MRVRYAQIDLSTGMVVADSYLSGIVDRPNLIQIPFDFSLTNKKYVDGEWVEYTPDPVPEKETVTDETILKMAATWHLMILKNTINKAFGTMQKLLMQWKKTVLPTNSLKKSQVTLFMRWVTFLLLKSVNKMKTKRH